MKNRKKFFYIKFVSLMICASFLVNVIFAQQHITPTSNPIPKISAEIVVNDGQPKTKTKPNILGEIVVNDGQPKLTNKPSISGEIVVNDGQPFSKDNRGSFNNSQAPAIKPFVGEIAVGVSLLITYAPQIIALASSIAVIASTINAIKAQIQGKVPDNTNVADSITAKLQNAINLLLGPLAVSNGLAKESVQKLSDYLLETTKSVNKSFDTNTNELETQLNESINMNKELNNLLAKGQQVSLELKALAEKYNKEFSSMQMSNQNQEYNTIKTAANGISKHLLAHADKQFKAFTQSLAQCESSLTVLENIKQNISSNNLNKTSISKSLLDARKNMLYSYKVLDESDISKQGIHLQIIQILTEAKNELENYAKELGISQEVLKANIMKNNPNPLNNFTDQRLQKNSSELLNSLDNMIDNYSNITKSHSKSQNQIKFKENNILKNSNNLKKIENSSNTNIRMVNTKSDELYKQMVQAYKEYIKILTTDPTNQKAIAEARIKYEKAQKAYQGSY